MSGMQAVYYRAADGSEPVDDSIEALSDPKKQAALDSWLVVEENRQARSARVRPRVPPGGRAGAVAIAKR